jgi:hypothetical protein
MLSEPFFCQYFLCDKLQTANVSFDAGIYFNIFVDLRMGKKGQVSKSTQSKTKLFWATPVFLTNPEIENIETQRCKATNNR